MNTNTNSLQVREQIADLASTVAGFLGNIQEHPTTSTAVAVLRARSAMQFYNRAKTLARKANKAGLPQVAERLTTNAKSLPQYWAGVMPYSRNLR